MTLSSFRRAWTAVRAADWWAYKIPPLLVVIYAALLRFDHAQPAWPRAVIAVVSILCVAIYGYVLNDVCDIEADKQSGRANRMASVAPIGRAVLLVVPALAALALASYTGDYLMLVIVSANLFLPTLYSVPPIRLKGRGVLGALADAGGVHVLPMALVVRAVTVDATEPGWALPVFVTASIGWALFAGLRGIIVHQVADLRADRLADVTTFAARIGVERARRLVLYGLFPCELAAIAVLLALVVPYAPVTVVVLTIVAIVEGLKVHRHWILPFFEPAETSRERYIPLVNNDVYEVWLPLALLADLSWRQPLALIALALHAVLFWPNIVVRMRQARSVLAFRTDRAAGVPYSVVIGATTWTVNGVNVFSVNMARELARHGMDAHILLTEQETDLVNTSERSMPAPADVQFSPLPVGRTESWGSHWGAIVRYLEESTPCVYIPNSDWRHSCVCPLLSDDVIVVGVVHSDDPLHYDHVRRLGRYWNAVVAVSHAVAEKTVTLCPEVADRITVVPIGVRIPSVQPERPAPCDRLRVVYHGILKQHQKRVLDFPRIVQAALDAGVPIELTLVGAGPDEPALREASAALVARGAIRFAGVVSPDDTPAILEAHDVYLLVSEFEGMPNALIEAMGRGLVPVVSRMESGIPELVRDGENGFMAPIGDAQAFAECLKRLWNDPERRDRMAAEAFRTVSEGGFRVEDMVRRYRGVFDRAWDDVRSGRYSRPKGLLDHPPAEVAGVSLFPVALEHIEPGIGAFHSADDANEYWDYVLEISKGARRRLASSRQGYVPGAAKARAALAGLRVFVAAPVWTPNGVNLWSEDLVRGLRRVGIDARIVLTEESTSLVTIDGPRMRRPTDIPVEELGIAGHDNWGARWGAMYRLLESSAPCVYIPSYDWRHAAITPLLSNRIIVIGYIPTAGDALHIEHAQRLGEGWNAVVAGSREAARDIRQRVPNLRTRLLTIPHGIDVRAEGARTNRAHPSIIVIGRDGGASVPVIARLADIMTSSSVTVVDPDEVAQTALGGSRVRVVRNLNRHEWMDLALSSDIVVLVDATHGTRRSALEAMARHCVPVVVGPEDIDIVTNGDSGVVVREGTAESMAREIAAAVADAAVRTKMADRAQQVAVAADYRADQMVEAYLELFERMVVDVKSGSSRGRQGRLLPPPSAVEGASVFPVPLDCETNLGAFPTTDDVHRFAEESGLEIRPVSVRS